LTKIGSGTLRLSGANSYSGGTFLNGGTLDSDSANAFGTGFIIVGSGTTLDLQSHNVANSITNNGGTILSTGTLDDVVATNGTTDIGGDGSTVTEVGGSATVNVSGSSVVVSNADGGTLNSSGSSTTVDTVSGTAVVNLGGTGAQVNTLGGGTVTFSNGATGSSVGTMSNGTLNANVALVVSNYNGGNIDVASRTDVTLRGGSSSGVISGQGGVTKQGATTLTLSGNNTFTGTTSVEEGRLVVAQGGSLASTTTTVTGSTLTVNGTVSGAVTASSGGVVGGSGTVGTLNILGGGVFAPGNSAGTTTATNGASWSNTGVYNWEIFNLAGPAGTGWDLLSVTGGSLNLAGIKTAGGFTINLITLQANNATRGALTGFDPTASYTGPSAWMIASAPTITGFEANDFTLNSSLFVGATGTFAIEHRNGEGLFLTYSGGGSEPIPEPGTWAAAALLALGAACIRRRRAAESTPTKL
jgi:autotransporter-associated beta strand protein